MKTINWLLLGGLGWLLFSAFKGKPTVPVVDDPDIIPDPPTGERQWITYSPYLEQTHPYYQMVPLYLKRFYTEKHLQSPFTMAINKDLAAYVRAFVNMKDKVNVRIYEKVAFNGDYICRITNFTESEITDAQIMAYLQSPQKFADLYLQNQGLTNPITAIPKTTPFGRNIWVLLSHLKEVSLYTQWPDVEKPLSGKTPIAF
jgi:hypothetical protein